MIIERALVEDVPSTFMYWGYVEDVIRDAADSGDVFADTLAIWMFASRFDPLFFNRIGLPSEDA